MPLHDGRCTSTEQIHLLFTPHTRSHDMRAHHAPHHCPALRTRTLPSPGICHTDDACDGANTVAPLNAARQHSCLGTWSIDRLYRATHIALPLWRPRNSARLPHTGSRLLPSLARSLVASSTAPSSTAQQNGKGQPAACSCISPFPLPAVMLPRSRASALCNGNPNETVEPPWPARLSATDATPTQSFGLRPMQAAIARLHPSLLRRRRRCLDLRLDSLRERGLSRRKAWRILLHKRHVRLL